MRKIEAWIVCLMAGLMVAVSPAVARPQGTEKTVKQEKRDGATHKKEMQRHRRQARKVHRLAAGLMRPEDILERGVNPLEVCQRAFDQSEDQKQQLAGLESERMSSVQSALAEVNSSYARKVEGVLDAEQSKLYEGLWNASQEYAGTVRGAAKNLWEEVGADARKLVRYGHHAPGALHLVRYLSLNEQQKKELQDLQKEMHRAKKDFFSDDQRPAKDAGHEAWKAYHRERKERHEAIQSKYNGQARDLLTPEQQERLDSWQKALGEYQEVYKQASQKFREKVKQLLVSK